MFGKSGISDMLSITPSIFIKKVKIDTTANILKLTAVFIINNWLDKELRYPIPIQNTH